MNIIITGASRGIGLELTRQALHNGHRVLAVVRNLEKAEGLQVIAKERNPGLSICQADVTDPEAPEAIAAVAAGWPCVDVLINNAGILNKGETPDDFMESFQINTIAPFAVTKALLGSLRRSKSPKVVHITSLMGSIDDNKMGGYYAYRASKAALNMINKSLAIDNSWLATVVVHPGWVRTEMGGPQAPVEPRESAEKIWQLIGGLKPTDSAGLTAEVSGKFFDFRGHEHPW